MQIDGSSQTWLKDRGTRLTLLLTVDDFTGTGSYARFTQKKGTDTHPSDTRAELEARDSGGPPR